MRAARTIIYGRRRRRQRARASNAPGRPYALRPFAPGSSAGPFVPGSSAAWPFASRAPRRAALRRKRRRLVDGLEHLMEGEQQGGLRMAQVVLVDGRFDLGPLGDHRAADEQAREEVAGEVHKQRARTARDHAVLVDLDDQADPAVKVLVRDVLRQPRVAREEVGLQRSSPPAPAATSRVRTLVVYRARAQPRAPRTRSPAAAAPARSEAGPPRALAPRPAHGRM